MEYLLLLALGFVVSIIFYKTTRTKTATMPPLPPGPTGYPIVGCLPKMVKNKPAFRWIHQTMQDFNTEIACFHLGRVHFVVVSSPELARQFLKEQDAIFALRPHSLSARIASIDYLSAVLAPGGNQWKKMKKIMVSEVLSIGLHERLHARRCEEVDHLVRYIYNQCKNPCKNGVINVRDAVKLYCGSVIRKLVFGKRFFGSGLKDGGPGIEEREHMDGLFTTLSHLYGFAIADCVPFLEMFDLDSHKKIVTNAIKCMRKYHDPEINNRVKMWRSGVRNTNKDILDVLISLKDSNNNPSLSIDEIKAQVNEIFLATIDNPSNIVEWAMAEMINQPHFLHLASKELDEVVGKNKLVQESDLSKLNYIKACVKEAFRLHPVGPFNLPHVSTADTVVGGYFIPKGSHILLSRLGLGRNPRVWEDPLEFKPERHIVSETSGVELNDPELRMLSFSIGRRGCPGVRLGSTMTTILLARLIQGFVWRPPCDHASGIDLIESRGDLSLATPLIAHAIPRLNSQVYQQIL
ncbi:phenylalanine N-monooxygenase-like protein [Perilla frutescens var. hirtella]|nr:phenylalanine N-monooxygenase-like protein [Perilla frutescens var. hirtella]